MLTDRNQGRELTELYSSDHSAEFRSEYVLQLKFSGSLSSIRHSLISNEQTGRNKPKLYLNSFSSKLIEIVSIQVFD